MIMLIDKITTIFCQVEKSKVATPPAEKKGKLNTTKFGQSKFGEQKSRAPPAGAPRKKRLW